MVEPWLHGYMTKKVTIDCHARQRRLALTGAFGARHLLVKARVHRLDG